MNFNIATTRIVLLLRAAREAGIWHGSTICGAGSDYGRPSKH
jgi:hypothetical protein